MCTLIVRVSVKGRPQDVRVAACPEEIAPLALQSVRRWRWAPAEEDGVPVAADTDVSIQFRP
ncbi:MAG: energy transducer TonB [Myxococcota bacterium]